MTTLVCVGGALHQTGERMYPGWAVAGCSTPVNETLTA
jgi:hypothetical protein